MQIGIFGGTFDPIHLAHLVVAEQSREQAKLDEIWFLPSFRPPHKRSGEVVAFERRTDMIALAIAGNPRFRVETIEKERDGPSFTADTLEELQRRQPNDELHLIVGADVLPELQTWHEPLRVIAAANLVVCARPGHPMWSVEQLAESLGVKPEAIRLKRVELPLIEFSSRDLRSRLDEGRSIKYLVPHAVEVYIAERKLYR